MALSSVQWIAILLRLRTANVRRYKPVVRPRLTNDEALALCDSILANKIVTALKGALTSQEFRTVVGMMADAR